MSNTQDKMQASTTLMAAGGGHGAPSGSHASDQPDLNALNQRSDNFHPDVLPYVVMSRICYMEYDPMNDRGVVPAIFARCIAPVIGNIIFLRDDNLNQIQVAVERNKSEVYFTHGWTRLRDFYDVGPGVWLNLLYINPFLIHMKIRSMRGTEIAYPLKTPPYKLMLDKNFQTTNWDAPIPFFVLPKLYSHRLEKTLTASDVTTGTLTLSWGGFCQNALPNEDTQLTLIDWLGNVWRECRLQLGSNPPRNCKISGQWSDICKFHRLAENVIVKFGVTQPSNNKVLYFKLSPFLGVRTTMYAATASGTNKVFFQSQHHFML